MNKVRSNGVMYFIMVVFGLNLTALSPLVAQLARSVKGPFNSGLLLSMHFIGFICVAVIAGTIADRIGKKTVITAGLAGYGLLFILFAISETTDIKYILMFGIGGCSGILESINSAYVSDNNEENSEYYVNVSHTWFGVGGMLGPVLLAIAIAYIGEWRVYYYILAAIALITAVVFARTSFPSSGKKNVLEKVKGIKIRKEIPFLLMTLAIMCYTGAEVASWSWLSELLQSKNNFTVLQAAFAVSLFWVAMTVGRFLCGKLLKVLSVMRMIVFLSLGAAVTTALMIWGTNVIAAYVLAVILGLACSSLFPFLSTFGAERTSLSSGIAFSTMMVCGNFGSAFIPYLVGELNHAMLFTASKLLLALCFMISAVCTFGANRIYNIRK